MDDRKSVLWACCLLFCAGCLNGGAQKTGQTATLPASTPQMPKVAAAVPQAEHAANDPKRAARVLVATAKLKESEAKTADSAPEQQFKMRDQARINYQEALKIDPTCIEAHRGLGRVYVEFNDFTRAQESLNKAISKFPKESIFWYELGQMHNRKKDFTQAATCLNKALEMEPENRMYVTTLGFTLARAGRTEESLTLLSRSMGVASAHYNVGRMLMHLNRQEEGVQHLRLAVQANPNLQSAQQLLNELQNGGRVNASIEFQAGE